MKKAISTNEKWNLVSDFNCSTKAVSQWLFSMYQMVRSCVQIHGKVHISSLKPKRSVTNNSIKTFKMVTNGLKYTVLKNKLEINLKGNS